MTTSKPARANEQYQRARRSLAGGVSSSFRASVRPEPLFVEYGRGAYLVDANGIEYVDFALAWGPLILGHSHPDIKNAVQAQLERGFMFGAQHELEFLVAEKIQASVPCAELVTYSNSGSEAVLVSLRLARAYTSRPKVLKFEGHYHGWTDSVLISYHPPLSEVGPPEHPYAVPGTLGQSSAVLDDVYILPWNDLSVLENTLQQHGSEIAAVIMEPVMCNSGIIAPAPGYLESVRMLTQKYDILLIFDEVITGFRLALGGAQEVYSVIPDIAIYAKAIAGGFPLSVVAGREDVMNLITNGIVQHSGTYNGNPISLAAANATLDHLSRPGMFDHLNVLGTMLADGACSLLAYHKLPSLVHQAGPMMQIVFTDQNDVYDYRTFATCNAALSDALVQELRLLGILTLPDGRWYLSTVHTAADINSALEALDRSLGKLVAV